MAAMLNCAIFDSAILNKKITSLIPSHSTWWCEASWILPSWIQPFSTRKNFSHLFWLILMMAAILDSTFLESAILKKSFSHSFWLLLMMAAILNSAMLDSATAILDSNTLLSSLRFTQKLSHSTLTLTQTNSIWLKLIHSPSTWWCQASWILPSWIQPFWTKKNFTHSLWLTLDVGSHLEFYLLGISHFGKKTSLIHSDSSWWWQPSWILTIMNSATAILDSDTLLSSLRFTQKHSHSNLTLTQTNSIWLICWWQTSWIVPSWIQLLNKKNHFTHSFWLNLKMAAILKSTNLDSANLHIKKLHSFILTPLDDGSHLKYCHVGFRHLGFNHSLRFTQKHSNCTLTLSLKLDDGSHLEL